jgi:hypothetical protein
MAVKINYNKEDANKSCVYAIFFGEEFYIGCTTSLRNRILNHQSAINRAINGSRGRSCHSYAYLTEFINANKITVADAYVLEECKGEDMYQVEAEWLYVAYRWADLLNGSAGHQNRYIRDTDFPYSFWKIKNNQYKACLDPFYCYRHFPH